MNKILKNEKYKNQKSMHIKIDGIMTCDLPSLE